jgi:predicted restriction endonuclease
MIQQAIRDPASLADSRLSISQTAVDRPGQPAFRASVLDAYAGRCAVSGTPQEEVLQAAHIFPYNGPETDHITNGLLLRADLHILFDLGLWSISSDFQVEISSQVTSKAYLRLQGKAVTRPKDERYRPLASALRFHRDHIFKR